MNNTLLGPNLNFKRGATNFFFRVFFMNKEIGEVKRVGPKLWEMEGHKATTREGAVEDYIFTEFANKNAKEEAISDPTFSDYDPKGLIFPNGDEVVGFWFIEDGVKFHLAIDKQGCEYETSDEPIKLEVKE